MMADFANFWQSSENPIPEASINKYLLCILILCGDTHSDQWMQKSENEMEGWFCALAKLQNVFILFYVKLV